MTTTGVSGTWGGKRAGAGRRPLGPPLRQVTVSLPVELVERLRRAGEGNISAGLRRLLEQTPASS